jgi:methyl-accepting chemotaxis protein
MGQVDRAVQQNASASEELAATAAQLTTQAGELRSAVGFFRLADIGSYEHG